MYSELIQNDPYLRVTQVFPRLSQQLIDEAAHLGEHVALPAGTYLFRRGDRHSDFFIVLAGHVEILETTGDVLKLVTIHEPGEFTGELDMFNHRASLVDARTASDCRLLRFDPETFRRLMAAQPDLGEIVMRAFILRRVGVIRHVQGAVVLLGASGAADVLRLQRFLDRNGYPYRLLDPAVDPGAEATLDAFCIAPNELPVAITPGQPVLRNPTLSALADALGLTEVIDPEAVFDTVIVGAGPSGLAAAVYAASEGLTVVAIEGNAPGGQAGTSSRIENYLGFPTGISGHALANRALIQSQKFGAKLVLARPASCLDCRSSPFVIELCDGGRIQARSIVIASGARYRRLNVASMEQFEGQGIHYAATAMEGSLCLGKEVVVVGGGNSAGQAAIFLAGHAAHVHLLIRRERLADTMSEYLIRRIEGSPKITLHTQCELREMVGERVLSEVVWYNHGQGENVKRPVSHVFAMIGAMPNTEWLGGSVQLDAKGFVRTGADLSGRTVTSLYESSVPGIFAVGDVRSGSTKRVASGVGEGSAVIQAVHQFLVSQAAASLTN